MGGSSLLLTLPLTPGCSPTDDTYTVSLVNDTDYSYAIRRAVELAGGLSFLKPGNSVLLKLALNSPNSFPATTSPQIVSEMITLLKENGAGDVFIGDRTPPWHDNTGGTIGCMEATGIYQAAVEAGAEPIVFNDEDWVHVSPEFARYWPNGFSMPTIFSQTDHIIVLPTLRTHQLAGFTMGLKIFMGAIPQDDRFFIHRSAHFLQGIAEIALCIDKIRLCILDARKGFSEEGPDSGTLVEPGIIIASLHLPAADATGLALLKSIGTTKTLMATRVWDHPTIKRGVEIYCPSLSFATLELRSEGVEQIKEIEKQLY